MQAYRLISAWGGGLSGPRQGGILKLSSSSSHNSCSGHAAVTLTLSLPRRLATGQTRPKRETPFHLKLHVGVSHLPSSAGLWTGGANTQCLLPPPPSLPPNRAPSLLENYMHTAILECR